MFRMEGGERDCEQGDRWSSSVGGFDALYAVFRRSVLRQCLFLNVPNCRAELHLPFHDTDAFPYLRNNDTSQSGYPYGKISI